MTKRAENAVLDCMGSYGTHEDTIVKTTGLPREEVDDAIKKMLKEKTILRSPTGVLWMTALHFDRLVGKKPWPDGTYSK